MSGVQTATAGTAGSPAQASTTLAEGARPHTLTMADVSVSVGTGLPTVWAGRLPRQDFRCYPNTFGFGPETAITNVA